MRRHQVDGAEPEEVRQLRNRKIYRGLLICFFLCMIFFTVLSRIVDSYRVPKVRTSYAAPGSVVNTLSGDGIVEAEDTKQIPVMEGLRIGRLEAGPGAKVEAGAPLFYYEGESLLEKRKALLKEIRQLELTNEAERLGTVSYEGVTDVELASQELLAAQQAYARQQEKTRKVEDEYTQNLVDLKTYYDKRMALSEEELLDQSRSDFNKSRDAYETAQMERDADIKSIKRKIKDTEKKIQRLEDKEDADEEELEELQLLLERYEDDLDTASEKWDLALEQAEDDKNEKRDLIDRAERGSDTVRLELEENYKNAVKQEEKNLEAAREEDLTSAVLLEKAAQALENAKKNDRAKALNADQAKRLAELHCESVQLNIDEKKEELQVLETLIDQGGAVTAPVAGVTALSELEMGKETAGSERFLLSVGKLRVRGAFDREEGSMKAGDEVRIRPGGGEQMVTTPVSFVDLVSDDKEGTFYAELPDGTGDLGESVFFECAKTSDLYQTVIPSSAVRKDTDGEFCLVLRTYKTILGEEFRAARVDLKILAKGDAKTAVEGALTSEDQVITGSDRIIGAGDRVRRIIELP